MNKEFKKIVASIQIIPFNTTQDESMKIIEKSIQFIKSRPNIEYRLGVMNTVIGGPYEEIMNVIKDVQEVVLWADDNEYIVNICIHSSKSKNIEIAEKEIKFVGI